MVSGPGSGAWIRLIASLPYSLANQVIYTFFEVGLIRIFLAAARGEQPGFGDLFSGAPRYLPFLGLRLLLGLIFVLGSGLLIVPGVIAYCGLWMAPYYLVDAGLGPIEAMKESWRATSGQKGSIFLFLLLGTLLASSGICACCVGVLATGPIYFTAMAIVFLRISGRGGAQSVR